ncbi:MAG: YraN family protein [Actinomycetota bacterium]|nr:YraN family protein [Actinomycetota bacterium]
MVGAGYSVLERNFRTRYGELDLIASNQHAIVFCEVKTRVCGSRGGPAGPLDAIGVTITPAGRLAKLEHVEDAF